eukprot:1159773-Pelagomonas_calceolata.AAC.2
MSVFIPLPKRICTNSTYVCSSQEEAEGCAGLQTRSPTQQDVTCSPSMTIIMKMPKITAAPAEERNDPGLTRQHGRIERSATSPETQAAGLTGRVVVGVQIDMDC